MKKLKIITVISFVIDRIIKIIVDNSLPLFFKHNIISDFLYLLKCKNEGAAFSLFSGYKIFLIIFTIICLCIIIKSIQKEKNKSNLLQISYGMLIGGILGNLFDRIIYGYVIDYIGITIFKHNFPIFNFADIFIVISAVIIIVNEFGSDINAKSNS